MAVKTCAPGWIDDVQGIVVNGEKYAQSGAGIQAAIDALPSGGVIYLSPGTYTPTDQTSDGGNAIVLSDNIHLIGSGPSTVIQVGAGWTFGNLLFASQKSGIRIANIRFVGPNNATTSSSNEAIQFEGVSDSIIENCEFTGWRLAIALNQDTLGTSYTTQRVTVRNNYINGGKSLGITLKYGPTVDCLIEGNRITATVGGISLTHDCHRNIVRNNRIYSLTSGLGVKVGGIGTGGSGTTSDDNLIEGNDISDCTTGGIITGDDSGLFSQLTGNRIIGNFVHDMTTGSGIALVRNQRGLIANNTVYNISQSTSDAINVSSSINGGTTYLADDNVVVGNVIYNATGLALNINGAAVTTSCRRNIVSSNIIQLCGSGIQVNSTGCVNNTIIGNIVGGAVGTGLINTGTTTTLTSNVTGV